MKHVVGLSFYFFLIEQFYVSYEIMWMIERKLKHNIWFRLCLDIIIIIIIKDSSEDVTRK